VRKIDFYEEKGNNNQTFVYLTLFRYPCSGDTLTKLRYGRKYRSSRMYAVLKKLEEKNMAVKIKPGFLPIYSLDNRNNFRSDIPIKHKIRKQARRPEIYYNATLSPIVAYFNEFIEEPLNNDEILFLNSILRSNGVRQNLFNIPGQKINSIADLGNAIKKYFVEQLLKSHSLFGGKYSYVKWQNKDDASFAENFSFALINIAKNMNDVLPDKKEKEKNQKFIQTHEKGLTKLVLAQNYGTFIRLLRKLEPNLFSVISRIKKTVLSQEDLNDNSKECLKKMFKPLV